MSNMRDMLMTPEQVMKWLDDEVSHVIEYSADIHRAYTQDEDDDDGAYYIPVAIVRQLIHDERIVIWRYIGQWNRGYNTYRPTEWVKAWKATHPDDADLDVTLSMLALLPSREETR